MSNDPTQNVILEGLFYGPYNPSSFGDKPRTALTIKKSELIGLGASGKLVGRYRYTNNGGYTEALEARITLDGEVVTYYGGSRVTTSGTSGTVDTVIMEWPNSARALTLGTHQLVITPGIRHGVLGGQHTFGIGFPSTDWKDPVTIPVTIIDG